VRVHRARAVLCAQMFEHGWRPGGVNDILNTSWLAKRERKERLERLMCMGYSRLPHWSSCLATAAHQSSHPLVPSAPAPSRKLDTGCPPSLTTRGIHTNVNKLHSATTPCDRCA
jgi:hypothetical protein